jgi:hypothetical protein
MKPCCSVFRALPRTALLVGTHGIAGPALAGTPALRLAALALLARARSASALVDVRTPA